MTEHDDPNLVSLPALAVEFGIPKQQVRQAAQRLGLALFVQYRSAETFVSRSGAAHLRKIWEDESS